MMAVERECLRRISSSSKSETVFPFLDLAQAVDRAGQVERGLGQRGLACAAVWTQGDVSRDSVEYSFMRSGSLERRL